MLHSLKYALHGIIHRKHKTGRELLQLPPCVHQCRRIGHEFQGCHHLIECLCYCLNICLMVIDSVCLADIFRYPPEHGPPGFCGEGGSVFFFFFFFLYLFSSTFKSLGASCGTNFFCFCDSRANLFFGVPALKLSPKMFCSTPILPPSGSFIIVSLDRTEV